MPREVPALVFVLWTAASLLVACGGVTPDPEVATPPPPTDDAAAPEPPAASVLDERPAIGERAAFEMPAVEQWTLDNGLEVWLLSQPTVPLVTAALAVPHGSASDPSGQAGLAALTADLLDEGTGELDALEFSEALDRLGSTLSVDAERDFSVIELQSLTRNLEPSLELMASAAVRPTLGEADFQRVKSLRLADLDQRRDDPGLLARVVATDAWFGEGHPYAHPPEGHAHSVDPLTATDVRGFHAAAWQPGGAVLVVVGDVTRDTLAPMLARQLGPWSETGAALAVVTPPAPTPADARVVVVPRPGAEQTVIRIVQPSQPVPDAEREAREALVNTLYGGSFTSRLMQNLREDKSWTYGAGSFFAPLRTSGMFIQSASIEAPHTGAALGEFRREIGRLRAGDIGQDELDRALATLHAETVQTFETQRDAVDELLTLAVYGQAPTGPEQVLAVADALTLDQVNAFASELAGSAGVVYVLVGDPELIERQIETAFEPGAVPPIEVRAADGTAVVVD